MLHQLRFIKTPHAQPKAFLESAIFLEWCQENDAIIRFETRIADTGSEQIRFITDVVNALDRTASRPIVYIITYEPDTIQTSVKNNMLEGMVVIANAQETFVFGHFALSGVVVGYRGEGSESRTSVYDTFAFQPSCRPQVNTTTN